MSNRQVPADTGSTPTDAPASSAGEVAAVAGIGMGGKTGRDGMTGSTDTARRAEGSTFTRGEEDATKVNDSDTEMKDAPAIQDDDEDAMDIDEEPEDYPMVDAF